MLFIRYSASEARHSCHTLRIQPVSKPIWERNPKVRTANTRPGLRQPFILSKAYYMAIELEKLASADTGRYTIPISTWLTKACKLRATMNCGCYQIMLEPPHNQCHHAWLERFVLYITAFKSVCNATFAGRISTKAKLTAPLIFL